MKRRRQSAALVAAALLAARGAWADGISGLVEEDFQRGHTEIGDVTGAGQTTETWQMVQRYRLALDKTLFPNLRFAAGGIFEQDLGTSRTAGISTDLWGRNTNFYASLTGGSPVLNAAAGFTRRDQWLPGGRTRLVNDEPSLYVSWHPLDGPSLFLRLSRPELYDTSGLVQDLVTPQALLGVQYLPVPELDLRYSALYANPQDRVHSTETTSLTQTGGANYGRSFAPWSTAVSAGLNVNYQRTMIESAGLGGTLTTQQFPLAGLSLVEQFPATPTLDTLTPNPALIDGSTTASAGLNLGFNPTLSGDVNARDLGVQFSDTLTKVNTFYVWVVDGAGRPLAIPDEVARTFQWTAWQSDDNLHWTQLSLPSPNVIFAPFQSRFELTLQAQVSARYLKVVTHPLSAAATTDRNLGDILVTELQVLLITPVRSSSGWQTSDTEQVTLGVRTQPGGIPDLTYDLSMQAARSEQSQGPTTKTYLVANGLTFLRRLSEIFTAMARLSRQDYDQGRGHEGAFLYTASLTANELPTLGHTLTYSGQTTMAADGTTVINSVSLFNRATPYRGVALLATFSWNDTLNPIGQTLRTNVVTVDATVQPNEKLTLGATYGRTGSVILGGAAPVSLQQYFLGRASFNPFAAFYVSGSVQRTITNNQGYTLANVTGAFSPFPGGNLQFTLSFNETVDTSNNLTRLITPGLRWNIARSAVLTVTYGINDTTGPTSHLYSRIFDVNLRIPF